MARMVQLRVMHDGGVAVNGVMSMRTLSESIDMLQRLVATADQWKRRYEIELMAHLDVQNHCPLCRLHVSEADWEIYRAAYAEAERTHAWQHEERTS